MDGPAKEVSQGLPPVLEPLGVGMAEDGTGESDAGEIIARFELRPRRYAGGQIVVRLSLGDHVRAVGDERCQALRLPAGDAIERSVESAGDLAGAIHYVMAREQMADWLETASGASLHLVRLRLLHGESHGVRFGSDEPVTQLNTWKGFELVEVLGSGEAGPGSEDGKRVSEE